VASPRPSSKRRTRSWQSSIAIDQLVVGVVGLGSPTVDGEDIYWTEGRPSEGGRNVTGTVLTIDAGNTA